MRIRPRAISPTAQRTWEVGANDQIFKAADYQPLIVSYHNGAAVRVSDIGEAVDSVEDLRNAGYANGKPSVLVIIFRQPGANIIDTVDRVRADAAAIEGVHSAGHRHARGAWIRRSPSAPRFTTWNCTLVISLGAGDPGGFPLPAQRAHHA